MWRIAILPLWATANLLTTVGLGADGPSPKPDALAIPAPAGRRIDADVWRRLTEGYQEQKQAFLELLLEMDANQIDYAGDCLSDIERKRQAVSQVLGRYHGQVTGGLTNPELESDYVRIGWEVWPRLTGNLVKVGPGTDFATLEQAFTKLQSGDLVQLGAGSFVLEIRQDRNPVPDLAFVGQGPDETVLAFKYANGFRPMNQRARWRLANLKIDCQADNPGGGSPQWIPGGAVELKSCTITRYGMNGAIARVAGALLIEDCLFDGGGDQVGGRPFGPMWAQGEPTYLRTTRLIDNRDMMIPSNAALVLDRCRFEKRNLQGEPNMFFGSNAWLRANHGINPVGQQPKLLAFDSDDADFIAAVLGEDRKLDERSQRLIRTLKLDRNAFYWIGLLRHRDEKFRRLAAERVQSLLGQEISFPEEPKPQTPAPRGASADAIARAIRELDSDDFRTREQAADKLRVIGAEAVPALRGVEQSGSIEQRASARALLSEIARPQPAASVPLAWEVQYGRIARWFDAQRSKLIWDEVRRQYVPRERTQKQVGPD